MEDRSEMECPTMRSIRELDGYHFFIPVYQRGFRWTRQQIEELIDDLLEFSTNSDKKTYCLQNVTVRKKDGKYEVIDGQQRLTAIWLLVMAYICSNVNPKRARANMPIYNLEYEKKELTDFIEKIRESAVEKGIHITEDPELINLARKDIDTSFIYDALKYIIEEYESYGADYSVVAGSIFSYNFFTTEEEKSKKISVIWNEITPIGEDKTTQTKYIIERFSNLNANKIPLTESELIKAYFIDRLADGKTQEFSLQWEEMERGFNNDEFWWFLASGEDDGTRLDMLFRIYLNLDQAGEQHALSRQIREKIDKKNTEKTTEENAEKVWREIIQIYNTLRDWYSDYYYYHVIGLIIAIEGTTASTIIRELYDEYNNIHSSKRKFKRFLKKRIRCEEVFMIPFCRKKGIDDWNVEMANDIQLDGTGESEISYVNKNRNCIKPILLLFNISLLLNAYNVNKENAAERFSFKIYKSVVNPIEIEHIHPKHLEGKSAKEKVSEQNKRWASWAKETVDTIDIIENLDLSEALKKEVRDADWSSKSCKLLIEKIEDAAHINSLSNLTLLDKNLNIRYGDNFFTEKGKHILAARFGYSIPGVKPGANSSDYYKQSVIFPGTMLVFMRQYKTDEDSNIDDSESRDMKNDRWNARDRKCYIKCMQESIFRFLSPTADESDGE